MSNLIRWDPFKEMEEIGRPELGKYNKRYRERITGSTESVLYGLVLTKTNRESNGS